MNNSAIKTYEDLEREERRLTARLATLKTTIREDVTGVKQGVKDKLNPVKKVKETVRHLFVREGENGPVINFALYVVQDFVIRMFIPNRTNIFTKTIIPFLTKNYVSNLVTEEQRKTVMRAVNGAMGKMDHFFSKARQKKQTADYRKEVVKTEPVSTPPPPGVDTNPMGL